MKVERQKQAFVPVVLTLETEAEVRLIKSLIGNLTGGDTKRLSGGFMHSGGDLYEALNNATPEIRYISAEFNVTIND